MIQYHNHVTVIRNSTRIKQRSVPDAIGIGFAKSGTGSMAMLRTVFAVLTLELP